MSKSKGNVVDPHSLLSNYGVDPLRYFLLKESSLQHDGGQCTTKNQKTHSYSLSLPPSFLPLPLSLSLSLAPSPPPPPPSLSLSQIIPRNVWLPLQMQIFPTLWVTYSRGSVLQYSTPGDPDSNFTPNCSPCLGGRIFTVPPAAEQVKRILH